MSSSSSSTAAQMEQWILQANDPSNPVLQRSAVQYLTTNTNDTILLQVLQQTNHVTVQFYVLSALQKSMRPQPNAIQQPLRRLLLSNASDEIPSFLRNKIADVLSYCLILDGGTDAWSTPSYDLKRLATVAPQLFLQVLRSMLEQFRTVASQSTPTIAVEQNRRFKNILKGYTSANTTPTLLMTLFGDTVQLFPTPGTLETIRDFLQYTDPESLGASFRTAAVPLLLDAVHTSSAKVAMQAWQYAIDDDNNDDLVDSILDRIHYTGYLSIVQPGQFKTYTAAAVDEATMDVIIEMSKFLAGLKRRSDKVLDLLFRCLAYDDIDVVTPVLPVMMEQLESHPQLVLRTILEQLKVPANYYELDDELRAEEEVFREQLDRVLKIGIQQHPVLLLQMIRQTGTDWREVLATLRIIGLWRNLDDPEFVRLLNTVSLLHAHPAVILQYYETMVRFQDVLQPDVLLNVLTSLTGTYGLAHNVANVRSRCCYLFLRVVKRQCKSLPVLFCQSAIVGLEQLLASGKQRFRSDDTIHLWEAMGLLVLEHACDSLQAILQRHCSQHPRDEETAADSIAAIAYLSKGFKKKKHSVFADTLPFAWEVLRLYPKSPVVRNKTLVYLQRMIQCVGEPLLSVAAQFAGLLIEHSTDDDLVFVSQLLNQISIQFGPKAMAVLQSTLGPFCQKCRSSVDELGNEAATTDSLPESVLIEQMAIRKLLYLVLQHVASYRVLHELDPYLQIMCDGATTSVQDPVVQKTCLRFFRDCIVHGISPLLLRSCIETHLMPTLWSMLLSPSYNERDANRSRVIAELSQILVRYESPIACLPPDLQNGQSAKEIEQRIFEHLRVAKSRQQSSS